MTTTCRNFFWNSRAKLELELRDHTAGCLLRGSKFYIILFRHSRKRKKCQSRSRQYLCLLRVFMCVISTFNSIMGMGSLAATAIEVLMQSWGEFNVSLVAALSVMLLAGVLHQAIMLKDNDNSSSTTNPESKGRLQDDILPTPLKIQNNEEFVVDDPAIATSSTVNPVCSFCTCSQEKKLLDLFLF